MAYSEGGGLKENVCGAYLENILRGISRIQTLADISGNNYDSSGFNKAKCMYLAQELKTRIASLPSPPTDKVRPVLRDVFFLVKVAEHLVSTSCNGVWFDKAFWMGDCTEAFGDVILDLQAAMDTLCSNMSGNYNGCSSTSVDRAADTSTPTYGAEWEAIVLKDRRFIISKVEQAVQLKADLRTGKRLRTSEFEIIKLLMAKLTGRRNGEGIHLSNVRIIRTMSTPTKRSPAAIICIKWHGKTCVMKGFYNDEQATKEASIMEGLTHPHIVHLFGVAYYKNFWAIRASESAKVLLEYGDKGDLYAMIKRQRVDFAADVIVDIMLQIAKGMLYIHSRKIVHLDLKSLNIFLVTHVVGLLADIEYFHVKIGDFGSAIRCDEPIPGALYKHGTTRWRAPELFEKAPKSATPGGVDLYKADVYSFAMVCVELLTRREPFIMEFPFLGQGFYEYISAGNRPSLPQEYPPELLSIICNCWDGYPNRRPSFEGVIESLKNLKREMLFKDKFYSVVASWEARTGIMWQGKPMHENQGHHVSVACVRSNYSKESEEFESEEFDDGTANTTPKIDICTIHPPFNAMSVACVGSDYSEESEEFDDGAANTTPKIDICTIHSPFNAVSVACVGSDYSEESEEFDDGAANTTPKIDICTIHPPFNAEGCKTLFQLGGDVKRKIDDFVNGGAAIGQHMFTSRLPHLQPILGDLEVQLQKLFNGSNNSDTSINALLFDEVFWILKKVEFFLAGCTWPALGVASGPTVTDEAFWSLRKDVQLCVHMMRYSMLERDNTSYEDVSNFLANPSEAKLGNMNYSNSSEDRPWRKACALDRHALFEFCCSVDESFNWDTVLHHQKHGSSLSSKDIDFHHKYLGSIALISDFFEMFERMDSYVIPKKFIKRSEQVYWGQGLEGMILGPFPFLSEIIVESIFKPLVYHQPAVYWAVKVFACESRKMIYDFRLLASLQHPHVVQMFNYWEDEKCGYVAMKLMQANVAQFLSQKQDGMLSPLFLVGILHQIAKGMSYLHSRLVRHHNLKCSNVLVGGCYEDFELVHVEVSDYGFQCGQPRDLEVLDLELQSSSMSSKEGIQFGKGEERDDEYAFDVYLFAMLCLEVFSIRGFGEEVTIVHGATRELSKLDEVVSAHSSEILFPAKCPPDLALYFQKCATKNPKERPKFPEICTTLWNYRAYMILTGNQGMWSGPSHQ